MKGHYASYTDEELVELMCRQQDTSAFDELYHRYVDQLMQTAWRKTGSRDAAEDLVQELFVKFWATRHHCIIQKSLGGYLHGMLRNLVVDYYHKEQSRIPQPLEYAAVLADEETSKQIQFNQLHDFYERSLLKVPEKCRQVFVLSRKGYSMKEIAHHKAISEKTVEAHISKALRILRVELKDYVSAISFLFCLLLS